MKTLGFLLLVVGVIGLVYGGITYSRERTVLDVGSLHATATEQHHVPISPIAGGLLVLGGVCLLVVRGRRGPSPA